LAASQQSRACIKDGEILIPIAQLRQNANGQ